MSKVGYFDRQGETITLEEWSTKQLDRSYWCVREFDNGSIFVRLVWKGIVPNVKDTWAYLYPIFVLEVGNYDSSGVLRNDPIEHGKTFPSEEDAVRAYENFLVKWSASRFEDDEFVEEENLYTPPPPPDLDSPMTETSDIKLGVMDDGVGAW